MEQLQKTFTIEPLIEKLKTNDSTVNADLKKYEDYLRTKYSNSNMEVFMRIGALYEAAGILEKAKDAYYTAKRYAEEEGKLEIVEMIMGDVQRLPGTLD